MIHENILSTNKIKQRNIRKYVFQHKKLEKYISVYVERCFMFYC